MKCFWFRILAIACSTTVFQCLHPSCFALINDSGSLRSWFGHERAVRGWRGSARAKGFQSQVSAALVTGNTAKSFSGGNADIGNVNILEQHNNAVEKPVTLTVVVGAADTLLGASIAKRLQASLKLTVDDLRSTQLLKKPSITSVLQNVATVIFLPVLSERKGMEGWLSTSLFSLSRRENSMLQDKDVEEFLKMCGRNLSRVICLSSIGANRVHTMPFTLRNIGGDLDTKRAIEQAVIRGSQILGYTYTIIRTGMLQEDGGVHCVNMAYGDALEGTTSHTLAEEAVLQSLKQKFSGNASFSIISTSVGSSSSNSSSLPDQVEWDDLFLKLEPELLRIRLEDLAALGNAATWAQKWVKPDCGLTTPVEILMPNEYTTQIVFTPQFEDYVSVKDEKRRAQDARGRRGEFVSRPLQVQHSRGLKGGIHIVVEPEYGRVRFVRSKRDQGVALKEMSERLILEDFKKDSAQAIKE